jgi:hypothetical protein
VTVAGTELPNDADVERRNGIRLTAFADGATIGGSGTFEGNVIAGHSVSVESVGPVSGFTLEGNLIGLAADGTTKVPTGSGIRIGADTTDAQVGGIAAGAGNTVIAENGTGIAVAGDRTRIEGNAIGLDKNDNDGLRDILNQDFGVSLEKGAEDTTIGGESPEAGNTIAASSVGIELREGSSGTAVEGNFIGTDGDGMQARGNEVGVLVDDSESGVVPVDGRIGGTRSSQRNVISGNLDIGVGTTPCAKVDLVIEGNYIGVGADGSTAVANGEGLSLGCDSLIAPAPAPGDGILVGGTAPGAGNRIAHNRGDFFDSDGDGVDVHHTTGGVTILGNEIFDNGNGTAQSLGIDFLDDGVSANGTQAPDVLPPFPILTDVDSVAAGTSVQGTIDHTAGRHVRIEFFSNSTCDDAGHGEGQTPLGALTLVAPGGPAAFSARVAAAPPGHAITATATDLDLHRTSEFSRCAPVTAAPPPPPPPPPDPPPAPPRSGDPPPPGPVTSGPAPPLGIPVIDIPTTPRCKVPNVVGLTPAKAKRRLTLAGCGVGKVTKPKRGRPGKRFRLVVKRTSVTHGGTRPPGTAIGLTLKWKRVKTRRR